MPTETPKLDAVELKKSLWSTLQHVRAGTITPQSADAVASQAREILRTVRMQLAIFQQAAETVSKELIDFAKP
jgi:hypothetical protein